MGATSLGRLAIPLLATLLLGACGVKFSDDFEGTELFKTVWLTQQNGAASAPELCAREGASWVCDAGSRLTVNVGVTDGYPVPVRVACYYEDPDAVTEEQENLAFVERATLVGEVVLPAREGLRPDAYSPDKKDDPEDHDTLAFSFDAPGLGSYVLVCLTPAAADNGVAITLKISE